MNSNGVLAIDFGTTNSYYTKCPADQISPVGIDFGGGKDGLATEILYRGQKESLIGDTALQEFGEREGQIPANWYLRTQFKPDIFVNEQSKKNAEDFLRLILLQSQQRHIILEPTKREVIFGVPSEMSNDYNQQLGRVAKAAGYGRIRVVDEPKGAILYHLHHKDFSPSDARKGILVIDFGGGTCDFAYLHQLNVRASWGDLKLGGRLFDDLFFQWFLDQNPKAFDKIKANGDTYYILFSKCREIKEMFSRTMARDRTEQVTKKVSRYGAVRQMSWSEFIKRAQTYKSSESFINFQKLLNTHNSEISELSQTTDLLQWFKSCLIEGIKSKNIDSNNISKIILAGGSSQWPFVTDMLKDIFECEYDTIIRSDRPYTVISEGLAILPALQRKLNTSKEKLKKDLPEFRKRLEKELIQPEIEKFKKSAAEQLTVQLFDEKLIPPLEEFRQYGGRISDLEKSMQQEARGFESEIEQLIQSRLVAFENSLSTQLAAELKRWLADYELALGEENIVVKSQPQKLGRTNVSFEEMSSELKTGVSGVSGIISGYVIGSLAGGGGIALLATGPIAAIVPGLAAAFGGYFAGGYFAGGQITNWIKKKKMPVILSKMVLRQKKKQKIRATYNENVQKQLEKPAKDLQQKASQQIEKTAKEQINAISEIDRI